MAVSFFCSLVVGCGGAAQTSVAQGETALRPSRQDEARESELRALKSQLALARAEAHELKVESEAPRKQIVRIPPMVVPDIGDASYHPEHDAPADDGRPRPSLTLYGDQASTTYTNSQPSASENLGVTGISDGSAVLEYRKALELVQARQFGPALKSLAQFMQRYPAHAYTDNALYWRGEIHYLQSNLSNAEKLFRRLCTEYPRGNKVPDALYKLGKIYQKKGNENQASTFFARLIKEFPTTAAAQLARQEDAS